MNEQRKTEKMALILNEVPLLCLPIALHTNATETCRRHRRREETKKQRRSEQTGWIIIKLIFETAYTKT